MTYANGLNVLTNPNMPESNSASNIVFSRIENLTRHDPCRRSASFGRSPPWSTLLREPSGWCSTHRQTETRHRSCRLSGTEILTLHIDHL